MTEPDDLIGEPGRSGIHRRAGWTAADARAHVPSNAADWQPVLERLGIAGAEAQRVEERARLVGVPFQDELLVSGLVGEQALFRTLAASLDLSFAAAIDPGSLVMRDDQALAALERRGGVRIAMSMGRNGQSRVFIAPDRLNVPALRSFVERYPNAARRLCVVPPSALRRAVRVRFGEPLMQVATGRLFDALPHLSARFVVNAVQGALLGALTVALGFALALAPTATLLVLHGICSFVFLACVALRLVIRGTIVDRSTHRFQALQPAEMPVYSVLVALYKEAEIVPDLLVALGRIVWPRAKLEIKLVCESDDVETLEALRAQELRSFIEVIEVPPGGPRTKPKALSYALPMTSGDFVALYDAEDRPHPFQLVEAWQRFRSGAQDLGCLQAPLVIANRRESWISSMFALEYSALFRGMLPWLARHGFILPLGGTSNHFRREALALTNGWDPYNVTEDADLGIRLHRFGYRTDVIANPTYEDAPTDRRTWVPQRTRWFKGWAQTWLVHMRNPVDLLAEIGWPSFIVAQILFGGMVVSALAYSLFLFTALAIGAYAAFGGELDLPHVSLLAIDLFNIALGHAAFLLLGWWTMSGSERLGFWKRVLWTPVYWTMMSLAAWRCLWQLYWRPHHWEKTPHKSRRHRAPNGP